MKGKAYANRRPQTLLTDLRASDFYETPKALIWELLYNAKEEFLNIHTVLEPCCGNYAISTELKNKGLDVTSRDLKYGNDFLLDDYSNEHYDAVITNPPFSMFNSIVLKARSVADKVFVIGKTNFFGSHERTEIDFWNELKNVWIFDRQIDYQFPVMEDGSMGVGCLVSCFMEWEKGYTGKPMLNFIDVQKYCKLGSYENFLKKNNPEEYQKVFGKKDTFTYEGKTYTQKELDLGGK